MNRTLYLHLGMSKTGTSAIQKFIFENRSSLLRQYQLYYPDTGLWDDHSHHEIAFSILGSISALADELTDGFGISTLEQQIRDLEVECADKPAVLISSEVLFKAYQLPNFTRFFDFANKYFSRVKAIIYLKRQDLWVESRCRHSIVSGAEHTLEYFQEDKFCNYETGLDDWARLIGKENLVVRVAESDQMVGGSLYADFLDIFDIELDDCLPVTSEYVNIALERDQLELKRVFNFLALSPDEEAQLNTLLFELSAKSEHKGIHKALLTPDQRRVLLQRYDACNRSIASRFLGRKGGRLFAPYVDDHYMAYPGLSDGVIDACMRYIQVRDTGLFARIRGLLEDYCPACDGALPETILSMRRSVHAV